MTRYEWLKQLIENLKQHPTNECVEWPYGKSTGYGVLRVAGQQVTAHRVAYAIYYGEEPGVNINHICANRACVNIAHMYVGTQYENRRDTALAEKYGINGIIPPERITEVKAIIEQHRQWPGFETDYDDLYSDIGRTEILGLVEKEDTFISDLIAACRVLLDYRRRAGALGFQLEKLDDYLRQIENILDSSGDGAHRLPRPEEG